MANTESGQGSDKFRRYRARLKSKGLRQIQLWVPDTSHPGFQASLSRQLARIESAREDHEALDFIEEVADWDD